MRKPLILLLLLAYICIVGVQAMITHSGGTISIDTPINDDVICSGGQVIVNAPVESIIAVGGTILINAPVRGDIFAAGGSIIIDGPVGGKVVAAGGRIDLKGNITRNVVLAGGTITLHSTCSIGKDALIAGRTVTTAGAVLGNLTVRSQNFTNAGVAGNVDYIRQETPTLTPFIDLLRILMTIGWFIMGLIFLTILPKQFSILAEEVRSSVVLKTIVGFGVLIAALVSSIVLAITLVGIPFALLVAALILVSIIISELVVSYSLGKVIMVRLIERSSPWMQFTVGFIVLNILFWIPILGWFILILTLSLGTGAIVYIVKREYGTVQN